MSGIITIVVQLLGVLPAVIKLAESIFGKGNGAAKKAAVVQLIPLALGIATDLSKGGQKNTLEQIQNNPNLSATIDSLAGMIFPSGQSIEDTQAAP